MRPKQAQEEDKARTQSEATNQPQLPLRGRNLCDAFDTGGAVDSVRRFATRNVRRLVIRYRSNRVVLGGRRCLFPVPVNLLALGIFWAVPGQIQGNQVMPPEDLLPRVETLLTRLRGFGLTEGLHADSGE